MTGLLNGFSEKYLQQCCLEWTFWNAWCSQDYFKDRHNH
jgi:hypothetical protein